MKYLHGRPRVIVVTLIALSVATLSFGLGVRGASAQDTTVGIVDFAFEPASLTVSAGSTVTWINNGAVPHTATSDSGAFDSGVLQPGASFSHTFDTAGTFSYLCTIHPNMTGSITVTEAAAAAPAPAAATTPAAPAAAAPQVARVPSTGVGMATDASGTVALLVALAAVSLGLATHLAHRRS
jgi:plastocyanin